MTDAAGMTIGCWGPVGVDEHLKRFERAISFRFGWRRLPGLHWLAPEGMSFEVQDGKQNRRSEKHAGRALVVV